MSAFELRFLAFKAVLGRQNSTKQLLSSGSYFLTPLLNFLVIKKTWTKIGQKA